MGNASDRPPAVGVAPANGHGPAAGQVSARVVDDLSRWLRVAASVVYTASTVDEAFQGAVDLVCEQTGWPVGHVLRVDEATGRLRSTGTWHNADPERYAAFVDASEAVDFGSGVGLPGRIMESGEPAWIDDLSADDRFPRKPAALACGLGAGFGFPIMSSRGLEGVMEFFRTDAAPADDRLLDLLSHVGIHLGATLDRVRAQRSLLASEARLRSLVESAPDALLVVDATGTVVLANAEAERLTGYPRADLIGRPVETLVPERARSTHATDRARYLRDPKRRGMGVGRDLVLRRRDGTEVPVDISLSPIEVTEGALVVAAVRDLTERRLSDEAVRASEAQLAEAQRLAHLGSWSWHIPTNRVTWSTELHRMHGTDPGAPLVFGDCLRHVHDADRQRVERAMREAAERRRTFDHQYRIVSLEGVVRWVHARGRITEEEDGAAVRLGGYCMDVTDQRTAEERRNRAMEDLGAQQLVLERIARGEPLRDTLDLLCRDVERHFPGTRVTVLLVDLSGRTLRHAAAPSLPDEFKQAIDGLAIGPGMGACGTAADAGRTVIVHDATVDPLTRTFLPLVERFDLRAVWSLPLLNAADEVLGTFAVYRRVPHTPDEEERRIVAVAGNLAALAIERHRSEEALAQAAQVDPLTSLPNRTRFLQQVDAKLAEPEARIAVMFLDLDRFKWVNDSLGHPAGDGILMEVARRFEKVLASEHIVARFGGDEFTVLIDDATPARIAAAAGRVKAAFEEPFVLDGGEFFLSVSVGIACNEGPIDAYGLVRDADAAMYAAKDSGGDRHVMFDQGLREKALGRVALESEIRRGIGRAEFVMHYEPIVDLASLEWAGVEALVRWHHPARGLTTPAEFIPLAEETGLIVPLGARVLEQTIAQGATWGDNLSHLNVGANLSVVQLSDPMIASYIALLLDHHDLSPTRLVLEVTESALMERLDAARAVLEEIAALGVRLVVDDFGTGYSSIARLSELPVVGIKIDRTFTTLLGVSPDADDVVGAIADLAHALGLKVVAEGIESARALDRARELGCDFGQGYHLGRPVPATDIQAVLEAPPPC